MTVIGRSWKNTLSTPENSAGSPTSPKRKAVLSDEKRQKIPRLLRREMGEIFYARNLAADLEP